jgi:hypothetical protein
LPRSVDAKIANALTDTGLVPICRHSGSDPRVCPTILSPLRTLVSTLMAWIKNCLIAQMHNWRGLLKEREFFLRVTSAVAEQQSAKTD